jgi:hypothetical protein
LQLVACGLGRRTIAEESTDASGFLDGSRGVQQQRTGH